MVQKNSHAQAGLEYLVTYGWALLLIATVVGAMVLILAAPEQVSFTSSDPNILVKGNSISNGSAVIKLQNISGGTIRITDASVPSGYTSCSIEGIDSTGISTNPITLIPGQEITVLCTNATDTTQPIEITYEDYSGLEQTVAITGNESNVPQPTCAPGIPNCCGNGTPDTGELCDDSESPSLRCNSTCDGFVILECGVTVSNGSIPVGNHSLGGSLTTSASGNCITFLGSNNILNCEGNSITKTGAQDYAGLSLGSYEGKLTVKNCTAISNFQSGILVPNISSTLTVEDSSLSGNYYGIGIFAISSTLTVEDSILSNNYYGISARPDNTIVTLKNSHINSNLVGTDFGTYVYKNFESTEFCNNTNFDLLCSGTISPTYVGINKADSPSKVTGSCVSSLFTPC